MSGRRLSLRDRGWLPTETMRLTGPFAGLGTDGLTWALREWYAWCGPSRFTSRIDRDARRWRPASPAETAAASVLHVPPAGPEALLIRAAAEPLDGRPLMFVHDGAYVVFKASHATLDGGAANALLPELLRSATGGQPAFPGPYATRLPLARALVRHFGADPRRLALAARLPRPVQEQARGPVRPWQPAPAYLTVRSERGVPGRIRAWREATGSTASAASVVLAAIHSAFTQAGLPPAPGLTVLVNGRRYLGKRSWVPGNFASGQYLAPSDPSDPEQVDAAISSAVAAGRPLTSLALCDARELLSRASPQQPRDVPAEARPALSLSHQGRLTGYEDLPWSGPQRFGMFGTPGSPAGLTVSIAELGGALHLAAAFHASVFHPGQVRTALELVTTDPSTLV
ncbi:hypothetical protein [Longispora albida]|uniref:hypothetical protein n=1 Tax=Longispora albida TaxID=203523 RepID=UPI0003636AF5|nr:hypothetical protein [Longispora albida]